MRQPMLISRRKPHDRTSLRAASVSSEYLRLVAYGAETRGLAPAKTLRSVGIDPEILVHPGARLPMERIPRLWMAIGERLRDPLFGLRLVEKIPFGAADLIDYLLRNCATVGESFRLMARFTPLLVDADRQALAVSGHEARLRLRTGLEVPAAAELFAGMVMRRSREIYGRSWSVRAVSFTHEPQGSRSEYDRLFQAPVRFGMPFNELVFHRDLLDLPQPGADARLKAILLHQAEAQLALVVAPRPVSFIEQVQRLLSDGMSEGDPSLTRVAEHLQLSMRTVQRRLRAAGVSHRAIVRKLRLNMAARSLVLSDLSQREIGRALGYSGAGSFHRAFKRWSGVTPGQARHRGP